MAHVHAPVIRSHAEIAERARNIHPGQLFVRAFLTIISALFISLGWTIGRSWFVVAFTFLWIGSRLSWAYTCSRMGYALGRKHNIVPERE